LIPKSVDRRVANLAATVGPATTLAISPWFNFDPINPIKVFFLACFAFAAIGLLIPYYKDILGRSNRGTLIILSTFIFAMFSAFIFSDADKGQQFWGVFGRNTGMLTYLSLALVFLIASLLPWVASYQKLIWSLVFTAALMVVYCLIQIAGRDPVNWSAFFPFGTLGNVNFLSGFLGIALVCIFVLAFSNLKIKSQRYLLLSLFAVGMFALYKSDSTQGVVALFVGIATFLLIKSFYFNRIIFFSSLLLYVCSFLSLVLGLFDRGPFRDLIYQFTVLYRADYMHAAYKMLIHNPWTGVGIDSYDDWYRSERGIISALRTSLNRTANSAHNISLDLAAGGGFPLLLAYLALIVLVVVSILSGLRRGLARDSVFMTLSMSWIAYQVQATVSINQVGVGVWGWILGGAIVGYLRVINSENSDETKALSKQGKAEARSQKTKKATPNTPPAIAVISSALLLSLGFSLSFLPLKTDADFFSAQKTGIAEKFLEITARPTANTFMLSRATSGVVEANLVDPANVLIGRFTSRFPRNIYGQLAKRESAAFSEYEREEAAKRIREIDPFFGYCFDQDPSSRFRSILLSLPSHEAFRLAKGWGLLPNNGLISPRNFSWNRLNPQLLQEKLQSFCGL